MKPLPSGSLVVFIYIQSLNLLGDAHLPNINTSKSSRRLAPCPSCKSLVQSFELGIRLTENGHYGGGDTAWEEENKKSYKNSELRLTEIQERLCSEVSVAKDQCHELATSQEELLEEWWYGHHVNGGDNLTKFLCIDHLKVCCPDLMYGPNCDPCPGYPNSVCSGRGKCKGEGTRKGSGECSCDTGYAGALCDECAPLFYTTSNNTCSACHKACQSGCSGPGAKNCASCKEGWERDEQQGCVDANECLLEDSPCKKQEFCLNTEGSYSCLLCDSACYGCYGDGPDMCYECSSDFIMKDNVCIEKAAYGRENNINSVKYATYCGVVILSIVVFQKNVYVASIMGVALGVYVGATEYLTWVGRR